MAEVKNLRSSLIREFDEVAYAKLVLLGTMAVGKTSLVTRFCFDTHKENQKATTQGKPLNIVVFVFTTVVFCCYYIVEGALQPPPPPPPVSLHSLP